MFSIEKQKIYNWDELDKNKIEFLKKLKDKNIVEFLTEKSFLTEISNKILADSKNKKYYIRGARAFARLSKNAPAKELSLLVLIATVGASSFKIISPNS